MYCPEGDCTQFWYKHYFDDFCAQPVLNTTHPSTTKHEISDTAANLPTALGLAPIVSAIVSLYLMCICSLLERMWSHCHIAMVQQTFATATTTRPQITAAIPLSPTVISPGGKVFGMVCEKGMRVTRGGAFSNDIWVRERKSLFMQPGGKWSTLFVSKAGECLVPPTFITPGEKWLACFVRKAGEWLEEVLFLKEFEWERESLFYVIPLTLKCL